ncbi:MAG: helix-hairpin-helix domain-containing protein [Bacteroidaceae bacterium]|nr:helix-hairpin-helix domain-containing protein [Bacteroidaceae bacterium]
MKTIARAITLGLAIAFPLFLAAQPARRDSLSWSEFVETFFSGEYADETDDEERPLDMYETLEEIHASPLNINNCSREDLMLLPFISAADADSIIAYRDRRAFLSLGELLFVTPLTYADRLYLPLFVYVGEKEGRRVSLIEQLTAGKYEAETRFDVPLYTREGNASHTRSELERYPNRAYHGNGLHHILRLRYKYGRSWAYGLTLEKDAGEPFAAEGNVPYDYVSFYLHHKAQRSEWVLGDYEVRAGQGLLWGNGFFLGKQMLVSAAPQGGLRLKPHTSTEENAFFRGVAARLRFGKAELAAFLSYRTLDASYRGDTILTLQTTGLHRTPTEIDRKDHAGALTLGVRAGYLVRNAAIGLNAYATRFSDPVSPELRYYSRYYFRGRMAGGASVDFSWHSARWNVSGEAAADSKLHLAYVGQTRFRASDDWTLFLQHRHLSPRFAAPYGRVLQEGSRCANEHGALLGATAQLPHNILCTAYADFFVLPSATFLNHNRTRGVEFYFRGELRSSANRTFQLVYRYKTKERGISGAPEQSEFVQTHRATARMTLVTNKLSLHPMLTACLRVPQASEKSFGWMAALRVGYTPSPRATFSAFGALFMSDDYQSALYAYEPQLPRQAGIPSFYYHGFRLVATASIALFWGLEGGLRVGSTHYFNRDEISSGTQLIRSSWKNDVSLQVRWRFQPKHKRPAG